MWFSSFVKNAKRSIVYILSLAGRRYALNIVPFFLGAILFFLVSAGILPTEPTLHHDKLRTTTYARSAQYKVTVEANDYAFMAPNEIPYGWITFVLNNEKAKETHELSIGRLPEGISYLKYLNEYVGAWKTVLKEFQEGKIESSDIHNRAEELLPEWSDQVTYLTSRGLVSPGRSAEKTIYLEPGRYTLDCWAKTSDGQIHLSKGMTRQLIVTKESANSPKPTPKANITLHKNDIEVNWSAGIGHHDFAVNFDKNNNGRPVHSNIHLIKINDSTNLEKINDWLNWYRIGGLRAPAPADFLGGLSTYYAGAGEGPAYFSVTIDKPGQYAWIVQVTGGKQLLKKFTIE